MSVTTRADKLIAEAKEHLEKAFYKLLEASHKNTWGSSNFKEEYLEELETTALKVNKLKRKI